MQANACAARRCRSLTLTTCFAAALELPKLFSKAKSNAKAAAKQVRAMRGQRRVAQALACICVICGFSSCVLWQSQKTEFTSKAGIADSNSRRFLFLLPPKREDTLPSPEKLNNDLPMSADTQKQFVKKYY